MPPEQRRATRTGPRSQFAVRAVLGGLGAAVFAVTLLVLISNQVNAKKSELVDLARKQQAATAVGNSLRHYGTFAKVEQERLATVKALAKSRFNWERVVRQLSRTVPPGTWLTSMKGTVSPDVTASGSSSAGGGSGSGSNVRAAVQGPAIELIGCTRSQTNAAEMMTRMRNLDGVTDVTLARSALAETDGGGASGGSSAGPSGATGGAAGGGGTSDDCPRYEFELLVVFEAPTPAAAAAAAAGADGAQPVATGTTGATGSTGATGATGGGQ
jgi:Tfp pilus assembly protein PilN